MLVSHSFKAIVQTFGHTGFKLGGPVNVMGGARANVVPGAEWCKVHVAEEGGLHTRGIPEFVKL